MNQPTFKPKDLVHYLDIAYELLYKQNQYPAAVVDVMQTELSNFRDYRAGQKLAVPSSIDAAIAAAKIGIQL